MEPILFILILIIPALAQLKVISAYKKNNKIQNSNNLSGFETARKILDANGLESVHIVETGGELSDHYDPTRKVVRLSKDVFHGTSISSEAIAAHECGHAIQDKTGYLFLKFRSLIFPAVNLGTKFSYVLIIIGFLFQIIDLVYVGIALVGLGLFFQIITLPVEFDASKRAKKELKKLNMVSKGDLNGTEKVLTAAALTYVAAVISSALNMLRLFLAFRDR